MHTCAHVFCSSPPPARIVVLSSTLLLLSFQMKCSALFPAVVKNIVTCIWQPRTKMVSGQRSIAAELACKHPAFAWNSYVPLPAM